MSNVLPNDGRIAAAQDWLLWVFVLLHLRWMFSYKLVCDLCFFFFQLHYYVYLWKRSRTYKTVSDKVSTFIKGPSWKPGKARLGDHVDNPKVCNFLDHQWGGGGNIKKHSSFITNHFDTHKTQAWMTQSILSWRIHIFYRFYKKRPHEIKAAQPL